MPAQIDPDLALDLAKATADAYADATNQLLAIVAQQMDAGSHDPDGWSARKLSELKKLQADSRQVVDRLAARTPGLVDGAVRTAYTTSRGVPLATHTRAVDRLVKEATTRLESTHNQILRSVADDYRAAITRSSLLVTTGAFSLEQAVSAAMDDLAKKGISGFTDTAGRKWRLDRYAEMSTRTAVGRAQVAGTLDRLVDDGRDLVIVSDHHGACRVCAPFEGKVLSITGASKGKVEDGNGARQPIVGTVASAQAAGLLHPNCRHSMAAFVPGLSTPPEPRDTPTDGVERRRARNIESEQQLLRDRRESVRTGKAPKPSASGGSGGGKPPRQPPVDLPDDDDHGELLRRIEAAFGEQARRATAAQRAAARAWQAMDRYYEQIQKALRRGRHGAITQDVLDTIAHLDELMDLGRMPKGVVAWRGGRSISASFEGLNIDELSRSTGRAFPIDGYTPTTLDRLVAMNDFVQPPLSSGAALIRVTIVEGTPAIWIPPLGDPALAKQQELLLVRGATMTLDAVDTTGSLPVIWVTMR